MRTLVTTVGVSLKANHGRAIPSPDPISPDSLNSWATAVGWLEASAESKTWELLGANPDEGARVILLHSDTPDGELCARGLAKLATNKGLAAEIVRVPGLASLPKMKPVAFNRGLAQLAHSLLEAIRNGLARGTVEIVATGGFKPEASIAHQIGAVLQVPVHYIHESLREVVTLDPLPLALDLGWVHSGPGRALLGHFIQDSGALVNLDQLRPILCQDERLHLLLDTDPGLGQAGLNVLGQIAVDLLGGPPLSWPEPSLVPPAQKVQLSMDHHKPHGWEAWLGKIASSAYVTNIRFEQVRLGSGRMIGPAPNSESDLLGSFSDGKLWRGVRIGTTCTNAGQRQMVANLLRKELAR